MGSRTCIGKHVSILEMSKLIPELVRRFDFELDEHLARPGAEWTTSNYWFVMPVDFRVRVKSRPQVR
jgi:cytochrome P450